MHRGGLLACRDTAHPCMLSQGQENQRNELPQRLADLFITAVTWRKQCLYHAAHAARYCIARCSSSSASEHNLTPMFCWKVPKYETNLVLSAFQPCRAHIERAEMVSLLWKFTHLSWSIEEKPHWEIIWLHEGRFNSLILSLFQINLTA